VGLIVAGLVTFDFFYADSRGREMWWPSKFEARLFGYMLILGYFVATETRKAGAAVTQVVVCVVAVCILHTGVAFGFRQTFAGPLTVQLFALAMLEYLILVKVMVWGVRRLKFQLR
jgi:hypothetical protein